MVIVEIIAGGKPAIRIRSRSRRITVGRGLDNDIVVDDPYVDANHIVLRKSAQTGDWQIEDLNSTNGTLVAGSAVGPIPTALALSTEIALGKTRLRLLDIDHPVAPSKSLRDLEHWLLGLGTMPWVVGLSVAVVIVTLLPSYLSNWQELKLSSLFNEFAVLAVALTFNTGVWSLLSRVLRGEARFAALLAITCIETLVLALSGFLGDIGDYNLPGLGARNVGGFVGEVALGCVFLYASLRLATNLRLFARSGLCVMAFVAILSVYFVNLSAGGEEFQPNPGYDGRLMPPPLRFTEGETREQFGAELPAIFDRAIELAKHETTDKNDGSDD